VSALDQYLDGAVGELEQLQHARKRANLVDRLRCRIVVGRVSDINMPGMSGLELLPKTKALRPDVPVIMITAYGDAETKRKALENGAEALLTKPIDFVTLRNEIDVLVEGAA
jgi:CheY-like chemotaxis protein